MFAAKHYGYHEPNPRRDIEAPVEAMGEIAGLIGGNELENSVCGVGKDGDVVFLKCVAKQVQNTKASLLIVLICIDNQFVINLNSP